MLKTRDLGSRCVEFSVVEPQAREFLPEKLHRMRCQGLVIFALTRKAIAFSHVPNISVRRRGRDLSGGSAGPRQVPPVRCHAVRSFATAISQSLTEAEVDALSV